MGKTNRKDTWYLVIKIDNLESDKGFKYLNENPYSTREEAFEDAKHVNPNTLQEKNIRIISVSNRINAKTTVQVYEEQPDKPKLPKPRTRKSKATTVLDIPMFPGINLAFPLGDSTPDVAGRFPAAETQAAEEDKPEPTLDFSADMTGPDDFGRFHQKGGVFKSHGDLICAECDYDFETGEKGVGE